MPSKTNVNSSPYFKSTPRRRSTRVSASSTPKTIAKKRKQAESESEAESEAGSEFHESSDDSASDFGTSTSKGNGNKRVKRDEDYASESEVETQDDDDEDEDDDIGDESRPMKRTVIPLPKLRDEGDVEYKDGRIHENTLLFLKDLKRHNNREWMKCQCLSVKR